MQYSVFNKKILKNVSRAKKVTYECSSINMFFALNRIKNNKTKKFLATTKSSTQISHNLTFFLKLTINVLICYTLIFL